MKIDGKQIGKESPCYFIADIAANHDGDLERAKDLIWKAAESGADAAKFQHFSAETIVSDYGFKTLGSQQSHQAKWKKSVFEVYQDASINLGWTNLLKEECKKANISFFTSPYSIEMVDAVEPFVPAFKIGSGDISWHDIIRHICSKQKPVIIATGASDMSEVERALAVATEINSDVALLQCNTNYTGDIENMKYVHLNVLTEYQNKFPSTILGLSDHTPGHATVLGAVALGAKIIEKHFTDDIHRVGPDHLFSMDPNTWSDMVKRTRELEAALGGTIKRVEDNEKETRVIQRRAIRLTKHLHKGEVITNDMIAFLRPCPANALAPYDVGTVLGKRIKTDKREGDCLYQHDIEE